MRTSIALAIYVSLAAAAIANDAPADWAAIHTAGIEADKRQAHEQALEYFKRTWPLAKTLEQQGVSANDVGQVYRELKQPDEAREWLSRAFDIWRKIPGSDRYFAVTASSLADLYRDTGDYGRAETFLREALGASTGNPRAADVVRNGLADLLREEGQSAEARELFLVSLHHDGLSWPEHINALVGLADIDRQSGDRETSAREWNEALQISQSHGDGLSEAVASRGLASLWLSTGNPARAEPLFRRALSILENNPASAPQDVGIALFNMGQLYRAQNKFILAQDAWLRALKLDRSVFGDLHPQIATLMEMLAEVDAKLGETAAAREYAGTAVNSMKSLFGDNGLPTAVAFANRAVVEQESGDLNGAVKDYERAVAITREHPGNSAIQRTLLERYRQLLKFMHRNREAKEISTLTFVTEGTLQCQMCDNASPH